MLEIGFVFAFIGRQLGRVLTLAFNWATIVLFGRVPRSRELYLSGMAGAAVAWPIVIAGIAFPSFATFLLGLVTVPEWLHPWVRLGMLVLAVILPLSAGFLSSGLRGEAACPRGRDLVGRIALGYPISPGLFGVAARMMF